MSFNAFVVPPSTAEVPGTASEIHTAEVNAASKSAPRSEKILADIEHAVVAFVERRPCDSERRRPLLFLCRLDAEGCGQHR